MSIFSRFMISGAAGILAMHAGIPETFRNPPELAFRVQFNDGTRIATPVRCDGEKERMTDLAALPGVSTKARFAKLTATISSATERTAGLRVSADWWFDCQVNHERIYSTMVQGNGGAPGQKFHSFPCRFKKGDNEITFFVERGVDSMKFSCQLLESQIANPSAAECSFPRYEASLPELPLVAQPLVLLEKDGSLVIRAATRTAVKMSAVFCSQGKITRSEEKDPTVFHAFSYLPQATDANVSYQLYADGKAVTKEIMLRPVNPKCPARFWVLGDTQHSQAYRTTLLAQYGANRRVREADFVIHIGDIDSTTDDFEGRYLAGFGNAYATFFSGLPLVALRGNHEWVGKHPQIWTRWFGTSEGKTYWSFRRGATAFIVLDSAGKKSQHCDPATLIAEQREFLRRALKTPEFRAAKFHILLVHASKAPDAQSDAPADNLAAILKGIEGLDAIDLMIAGHIHRPLHLDKGVYVFPAVTMAGPGWKHPSSALFVEERSGDLRIEAYLPDGTVIDTFQVKSRIIPERSRPAGKEGVRGKN
ncbi:MAG: metallophosphoesterase [Victivallaceae bacterium]|nr:metallophosphoesterase [Victivallaceae bacterium]